MCVVHFGNMLYDGEAEAGAAGSLGAALVDAVEAFKDAWLIFFGNTDARIPYDQRFFLDKDLDAAALFRIADGIVD